MLDLLLVGLEKIHLVGNSRLLSKRVQKRSQNYQSALRRGLTWDGFILDKLLSGRQGILRVYFNKSYQSRENRLWMKVKK